VQALTHLEQPPLVPELRVRVATELMATWEATERHFGHAVAPPFWAFLWPGSQALARVLLDRPELVKGQRVLDFGSGCGLAAIAAARCGASRVVACDVDPVAAESQQTNAAVNGVCVESVTRDLVGRPLRNFDVVLAGDVCYERMAAHDIADWLGELAEDGLTVLLADPGRAYAPADGLELLASFTVPTSRELESENEMLTRVWRLTAT
jgi:predicted nicotinamide N-methyase